MMGVKGGAPVYLLQIGVDAGELGEIERKIQLAIPLLTRASDVEQIEKSAAKAGVRAFAVVVAPSDDADFFAKLIGLIPRHRGNIFFILISGEISGSNYKQLMQTGNADWVAEDGLPSEIVEIIARHTRKPAGDSSEIRQPLVVSFVPSAGGVGNSTLAIETAIHLGKRKGAKGVGKVGLVDLDFQTSHVCDYLDIAPQLQVEEIIGAPDRLDNQLLDIFASRHPSGLDVFAAPRSKFHSRDLTVEALSTLFDLIAQRYDAILIDLPVTRFPWTTPVLGASQGILVVGANTIPGLRRIAETLEAVRAETGAGAETRVVINRCEFGLLGGVVRSDHVTRVLGEEKPLFIRDARIALDCINAGTPMTLANPSDKVVKDIAAIAEFCAARKPVVAAK